MENLQDIVKDLKNLLEQSNSEHVRKLLRSELEMKENQIKNVCVSLRQNETVDVAEDLISLPVKSLTNFGWDQSNRFVKIYLTSIPYIDNVLQQDINCCFEEDSINFEVIAKGIRYQLKISGLLHNIKGKNSSFKLTDKQITIFLRKSQEVNWPSLTKCENILQEKKKNKMANMANPGDDPSASMMNLLKQMYQDGDDKMKQEIAKTWTQSQEKAHRGEMMGDNLPGMGNLGMDKLSGLGDLDI
ncbi:hypothetical protein SNEBB_000579 [Seison nebaliae]|nr:hypothetical protein SNEBB_000579 [Seison nebaliae]